MGSCMSTYTGIVETTEYTKHMVLTGEVSQSSCKGNSLRDESDVTVEVSFSVHTCLWINRQKCQRSMTYFRLSL